MHGKHAPHVDDGAGCVVWQLVEPFLSTPGIVRALALFLCVRVFGSSTNSAMITPSLIAHVNAHATVHA